MQMILALKRRFLCLLAKAQALALLGFGQRERALVRLDRLLASFPADRYSLASRAHVLVQLNRLEDSIDSLLQLSRLTGSPAQQAAAWFNLGYVLQQAGRHEEAGAAFENAIQHNACMDGAWYGLALVLIHQGQFHEARRALQKTTALQPMSPYGWYRLAEVNLALGEPQKARQVIDHLRQFEPRVAAQLEREIAVGQRDAVSLQSCDRHDQVRDAVY
jgi:tetratricopeptide (TPR) repeat protein